MMSLPCCIPTNVAAVGHQFTFVADDRFRDVKLWMKQDNSDVPEMIHWAKAKAPFRK
jgi:hypothetical protein